MTEDVKRLIEAPLGAEDIDTEQWAPVKGTNGDYLFSSFGRMKSFKKDKKNGIIMFPHKNNRKLGNYHYNIRIKDGVPFCFSVSYYYNEYFNKPQKIFANRILQKAEYKSYNEFTGELNYYYNMEDLLHETKLPESIIERLLSKELNSFNNLQLFYNK